jgi:hypothetical protein
VLHSSTSRFSHRPYHFAMSVYFSAIKRDLAILTEWWQQRIAWWELLNAARQIICIRKQHTHHMEDDIKRILQDKQFHRASTAQIRAEGNSQIIIKIIQILCQFIFQPFVTWLRENYDYRNVSWEMICIYDLTLSKMRGGNVIHALSARDKWLKNKLT